MPINILLNKYTNKASPRTSQLWLSFVGWDLDWTPYGVTQQLAMTTCSINKIVRKRKTELKKWKWRRSSSPCSTAVACCCVDRHPCAVLLPPLYCSSVAWKRERQVCCFIKSERCDKAESERPDSRAREWESRSEIRYQETGR